MDGLITKRGFLRGAAAFAGASLFAKAGSAQAQYGNAIPLGDSAVAVWVSLYGPGLTYFAPHDSENTCVEAAHTVLSERGGTLIQLKYGGTRNITFTLNGVRYECDPNRIFTDEGIQNTLQEQGGTYSDEARQAVAGVAQTLLGVIDNFRTRRGRLVALHNNTNNNFSIESYYDGGSEAGNASRINQNPDRDKDDFFFTTEAAVYDALAAAGMNIAEQSSSPKNDGSLSVYAGQARIPYTNVEAQHGHLEQQTAMLNLLASVE